MAKTAHSRPAIRFWAGSCSRGGRSKHTSPRRQQGRPLLALRAGNSRPPYYRLNSSSGGRSGDLPYRATYLSSNVLYLLASQMKHCDLARSCSSHQSPLSLNFVLTFASGRHWLHSSSGTPCSAHHQPSCLASPLSPSFFPSLAFACKSLFLSIFEPRFLYSVKAIGVANTTSH